MSKLGKDLSGIAGEYFTAAELSRRGFIAAVTLRNTRGVDIFVSRPGGKKSLTVQVKTIQKGNTEWVLNKIDETPKGDNHYYVFVALNSQDGQPEYYIANGDHVAERCQKFHKEYLEIKKKDGNPRKDTNMRVFRPEQEHRNAWKQIHDALSMARKKD